MKSALKLISLMVTGRAVYHRGCAAFCSHGRICEYRAALLAFTQTARVRFWSVGNYWRAWTAASKVQAAGVLGIDSAFDRGISSKRFHGDRSRQIR